MVRLPWLTRWMARARSHDRDAYHACPASRSCNLYSTLPRIGQGMFMGAVGVGSASVLALL